MNRFGFLLLFNCFCFPAASGKDFHVSWKGNDTNPGTETQPLRSIQKAVEAAGKVPAGSPRSIIIHDGNYYLDAPIDIGPLDSGLQIRASHSAKSKLFGARTFALTQFLKLPANLLKRARPEVGKSILMLDLKTEKLTHTGPWKDVFPDGPTGLFEIYAGGRRLPLSRYPNTGFMAMAKVISEGDTRTREPGVFQFKDQRHRDWKLASEKGLWLKGFWRVPWQSEYVRIADLDLEKNVVELAVPVSGGIGSKYHRPHGSGKEPYLAINLLEEIDLPGEWAIDFSDQKLYLLPTPEMEKSGILIADSREPLIRIRQCKNVEIKGLHFEATLGNGVEIEDGEGNEIRDCVFHNIGEAGIVIRNGTHHTVRNCEIRETGAQGVLLSGGDRKTLTPCNHQIINNHIHHFARVKTIYAGGVHVDAVGAVVRNNLIHDTPHVGIHYKGNDNLFERNELYHIAQVSNDMGGFYTWGDWTSRGNIIRHNLVHSSPQADGVYCDDGDSGDTIEGNIFVGLHAGVLIGGGRDNHVSGNVAVNCEKGFHVDDRGASRGYNLHNRRMVDAVKSVNHRSDPWSKRYPEMVRLLEFHPDLPVGTKFIKNLAINCKQAFSWKADHPNFSHCRFDGNEKKKIELPDIKSVRTAFADGSLKSLDGKIPVQEIGLNR